MDLFIKIAAMTSFIVSSIAMSISLGVIMAWYYNNKNSYSFDQQKLTIRFGFFVWLALWIWPLVYWTIR